MSRVECGLEIYDTPDAQGAFLPEGDEGLSVEMGEDRFLSGGVYDHGAHEEDDSVTWETLAFSFREDRAAKKFER